MLYLKNIDFPKSIFSAFVFVALLTRERKTRGKAWSELEFHPSPSKFCQSKERFVNDFAQRCVDLWLFTISPLSICRILPFSGGWLSAAALFCPAPLCSSVMGFEEAALAL